VGPGGMTPAPPAPGRRRCRPTRINQGVPTATRHDGRGRWTDAPPGGAMPTATTSDPRAWRADTLDAPATWYYPLSERALASLDRAVSGWTPESRPLAELKPSDELRAAAADEIGRARAALEEGRGFAVITAPP